jgi:hypothetical protein
MRELRHGVKLKKVQEKEFNPLPTEFQLTPFEMLMQDIRARNYKLRKVMVSHSPVALSRGLPIPLCRVLSCCRLPVAAPFSHCLPLLVPSLVLDQSLN